MSQFFISCKESRIESNKSFYGCFYLGPFEPSQSITIANTLRRTLLSELYGLGIVSVEIEGATHEYSSLPGIKESVLDILLNLKEIVLKKTIKNFKPQIGYLRVRGPGIVNASHLRLPPFIESVDPEQYIATLAEDGVLNMKFVIQYGNKWMSSTPINQEIDNSNETLKSPSNMNIFNVHLKKRQLILKKLNQIGITSANTYMNMFSKSSTLFLKKKSLSKYGMNFSAKFNKKYSGINLKIAYAPTGVQPLKKLSQSIEQAKLERTKKKTKLTNKELNPTVISAETESSKNKRKESLIKPSQVKKTKVQQSKKLQMLSKTKKRKQLFFNSNPLTIDAVFNPINKVNYIIDVNDFKTTADKIKFSSETSELYEMFINQTPTEFLLKPKYVDPIKNKEIELKNVMQKHLDNSQSIISSKTNFKWGPEISDEIEKILDIKREINLLKKETTKHNITLEIWTNGSVHPRDALYQSFKHLIKIFSKLKKLNSFVETSFFDIESQQNFNTENNKVLVDNKQSQSNKTNNNSSNKTQNQQKEMKSLLKKIKLGEINSSFLKNLLPLNGTSYLSTYIHPQLKDYYLNPINVTHLKTDLANQQNKKILEKEQTNDSINSLNNKQIAILMQADIRILNLSLRSYTILKRLGIISIKDFLQSYKKNKSLFSKNSFDIHSLKEIKLSFEKISFMADSLK